MAFDIKLQVNTSEKNKLDKTLTDVLTVSGELKGETSIIDPVILFEGDFTQISGTNYMTIEAFKRSYFITGIKSIRNNLVEISAHVDVLSTYKSQIRSNTGIIKRQEKKWNLYLNDGVFKVYQNPNVLTMPFPSGFTTQEFVLAVAGS